MDSVLNFQSIIMTLQKYWSEQGCLIWQPYYTQVGAGTYNPATFLRVLGPEPWYVGYVEPSIRPDDGRYGDNPNRLQQHYQFQVILKPDPGNPQEVYLGSLEALGINPEQHDIRFVEDNWESPALGAWGLGWEVWLDGQEITQFTYFQQAGGMVLDPVSVEITYGLERIAIALQQVRSFRDIRWNDSFSYGDVNLQGEREHSAYYFDTADIDKLRDMYDMFEAEAISSLDAGLVLPAHDYVLKCSHTFNILDTRGAVGVTERQALFARMRDLSRRVAEAYYEQRQAMSFPWLTEQENGQQTNKNIDRSNEVKQQFTEDAAAFLLEIGTEELPAEDLTTAISQLEKAAPKLIENLRLEYSEIQVMGTPRRLILYIKDLATKQPDREVIFKGPPEERAFDQAGKPTKAAIGFAKGRGIEVADLTVEEIDGGRYVVARVSETGLPSIEILEKDLHKLIAGIHFNKTMRWNDSGIAFSRPIRWLLALHGDLSLEFNYAGLVSKKFTRGLRFSSAEHAEIKSVEDYFESMQEQKIVIVPDERQKVIEDQVKHLISEVGGEIKIEQALLEEVKSLVETPTAFLGSFEESYLQLPVEVLVSVMKKHLRYFPVWKNEYELLPYFISVRNGGDEHIDVVRDGNEQVIRARFADAAFFIEEDSQTKIEDLLPRLGTLTFQFKLGSMLDKSKRIEKIVDEILPFFNLSAEEKEAALRGAHLCKADLVSHMVVEMTSLQGTMGSYYAANSGENDMVVKAIAEHYMPRSAGDKSPETKPGLVVSVADRLDTLSGLFAAGLAPTGTKDPFAQRRAALGLVQNLINWNTAFDLEKGLEIASKFMPLEVSEDSQKNCLEFIVARLKNLLIDDGYHYDIVDAVLAEQMCNPSGAVNGIKELSNWADKDEWAQILPAYSRCVRITREIEEIYDLEPSKLKEKAEIDLYAEIEKASRVDRNDGSVEDFFKIFLPLIPFINKFFDDVLVMSEDVDEQHNRLGLLQKISHLADSVADFSYLEGF